MATFAHSSTQPRTTRRTHNHLIWAPSYRGIVLLKVAVHWAAIYATTLINSNQDINGHVFFFFLLLNFKDFYVSLAFLGQSVAAAALVGTQVYRPLNVCMYICMYVCGWERVAVYTKTLSSIRPHKSYPTNPAKWGMAWLALSHMESV